MSLFRLSVMMAAAACDSSERGHPNGDDTACSTATTFVLRIRNTLMRRSIFALQAPEFGRSLHLPLKSAPPSCCPPTTHSTHSFTNLSPRSFPLATFAISLLGLTVSASAHLGCSGHDVARRNHGGRHIPRQAPTDEASGASSVGVYHARVFPLPAH
jgi:hypothetical protein